jgi:hypothetical protein
MPEFRLQTRKARRVRSVNLFLGPQLSIRALSVTVKKKPDIMQKRDRLWAYPFIEQIVMCFVVIGQKSPTSHDRRHCHHDGHGHHHRHYGHRRRCDRRRRLRRADAPR